MGLVEHIPNEQARFDPRHRGLDHLAFTVGSPEELDQWAQRLSEASVAYTGPIEIPAGAILNFKDPDGISLALFWDRD